MLCRAAADCAVAAARAAGAGVGWPRVTMTAAPPDGQDTPELTASHATHTPELTASHATRTTGVRFTR